MKKELFFTSKITIQKFISDKVKVNRRIIIYKTMTLFF